MEIFIAFLRGINLGGRNKILMRDLKACLNGAILHNLQTYLQSGNLIFNANRSPNELRCFIQETIKNEFDLNIPVLVIRLDELAQLANKNPYLAQDKAVETLHLTLLESENKTPILSPQTHRGDSFIPTAFGIYLYTPNGYRKTKFNNAFFEKKFNQTATTRNWKTVMKMVELGTRQ